MLTLPFFLFATRVFYGKDNRKRYFRTEYLVAIVYSMVMEVVYRCIVSIVYLYSARVSEALDRLVPLVIVVAFTACFHKMLGFSIGKTAWRSVLAVVLYYVILGTVLFIIGIGLFLYIILIRHKLAAGM
jgi:predicted membrane protein